MSARWGLLAATLALAHAPQEPLPKPPPAGLPGLVCVSELAYPDAPDESAELNTTYAGDRARWLFTRRVGGALRRALHYRRAERCFRVPELETASEELSGARAEVALLGFELRRALLTWPEGFAWTGSGELREAPVPGVATETPLRLEAKLGADGRPVEMAGWRGSERGEGYRSIRWREQGGRWIPAEMELAREGATLWRERIRSVDTRARFLDSFFLPPDRRSDAAAPPQVQLGRATLGELPPLAQRRFALQAKSWPKAVDEARRLAKGVGEELARADLELDPGADFELSELGEPSHCLLRLAGEAERLPDGWIRSPKRSAVTMHAAGPPPLAPGALEKLYASLPQGARAGKAYLRLPALATEGAVVQLVLPYERR